MAIRRDNRSRSREREPRTNRRIRAREVMVVDETGKQLGVMPTDVALNRAQEAGLDLVEVAPDSSPPVCKILDFGRYKYQMKKRQNEAKKQATAQELKEVKLRPKTDEHDYDFKLKHARRFLEGGDKVKVTIMFRGREVIHKDIAFKRLERIAKDVQDLGKVETMPRMEGRQMHMILAPDKVKLEKLEQKRKQEASAAKAAAEEAQQQSQ
jgi:translation initiation factor IF-3